MDNIFQEIETNVEQRLIELGKSGRWRNYTGVEIDALTQILCETFAQEFVHLCASGTYSVELALRGLKIGEGDQVILSAFDFPGNFRAIEAVGAMPVLLDLDDHQWFVRLPEADFRDAKAIILSPLYGSIPDMAAYRRWCDQTGTHLILDQCQCPGSRISDPALDQSKMRSISVWADAVCLSFGGSKILSAGRGGAVLTNDQAVAQRMKIATDRGNDISPLSLLQAAVLIPQIQSMQIANQLRNQLIEDWSQSINEIGLLEDPFIQCSDRRKNTEPVYYKKAWLAADEKVRDLIVAEGDRFGIGAGFRGFTRRSSRRCRQIGEFTNAIQSSQRVLLVDHQTFTSRVSDSKGSQIKKEELCDFLRRFL